MEAPETAKEALEKCRARGLDVSIDDFGTGYSSLSYLHYFPIDTLKIDQSFIRAMTTHHASMVLVKSISTLAHNLNMRVIAEGIETQHEAEIMRNLGCELCQGYWFAKPMPLEQALDFMQSWQPPRMEAPRRAAANTAGK
jgi:EAL domain-containing protein (putative c-di-GMP-specific phosphodiesterase class I)